MRTTVTLEPDVEALIRALMGERGLTFKQAVNTAIREGRSAGRSRKATPTPTFSLGFDRSVPGDKALRLAADLEDEELARKLAIHK